MAASAAHADSLRLGRRVPHVVYANAPELDETPRPAKSADAPPVIGTIGVLLPRKGTDLFVTMAERLHAAGVRAEFRICGSLDPNSEIANWGLREVQRGERVGVRWLGQADVAAELHEWDVMVMPSRRDPFPVAVLEALAAGVPVVGAAVDGIAEQLADGAGVLVPPEDPDALAAAVRALLDDPSRRKQLAADARSRARLFSLERTANELAAVWRAALAR
jgi:glycosyltransferase involved in cell wall biosynthesis